MIRFSLAAMPLVERAVVAPLALALQAANSSGVNCLIVGGGGNLGGLVMPSGRIGEKPIALLTVTGSEFMVEGVGEALARLVRPTAMRIEESTTIFKK